MSVVLKRPTARIDIAACALSIGGSRPDSAERFLGAIEATLNRLAERPGLGEPCQSRDPRFATVRRSR